MSTHSGSESLALLRHCKDPMESQPSPRNIKIFYKIGDGYVVAAIFSHIHLLKNHWSNPQKIKVFTVLQKKSHAFFKQEIITKVQRYTEKKIDNILSIYCGIILIREGQCSWIVIILLVHGDIFWLVPALLLYNSTNSLLFSTFVGT